MHGDASGLTGGRGLDLEVLRFHLVNFADELVRRRLIEVDGWTIQISSTGTSPTLNAFAVSHVVDLARSDGTRFSVEDAELVRSWLFDALSFAAGQFVGFAVAQGYVSNSPVYIEASCTKTAVWRTRRSWWDGRAPSDADLAQLCTRWAQLAEEDRTREVLRRAAGSYVAALTPDPLDTVVPVAGIGIELMVWELIHQRDQLMSTDEFDRLSFASRMRLALRAAEVPSPLPSECTALRSHLSAVEIADGPQAFAGTRNRLVHPPTKKRGWPGLDEMTEAWMLGCEYLALLILSALGFTGQYRSQFNYSGWPGSEVTVPWAPGELDVVD
jgi:hypothetical protein